MTRGLYIMANDQVIDYAIACLNSIRLYDAAIPIVLIPYDDDHQQIAPLLQRDYGVDLYPDLDFIERLSVNLQQIFGPKFFARPNQFRKQACWFGPFDRFLYLDLDIVVFSPIARVMDYLERYDFLCYDFQHKGGLRNVFTPAVIEQGIFTESELQDIFNCGFWAAKKGLFSEPGLYETFRECAANPSYFDFSEKTSDQPIINYLILKQVPNRFNLVRQDGGGPGSWAGSTHFLRDGATLVDPNVHKPLDYLHWAGFRIQPGCPYWDIWSSYRYLRRPDRAMLSTAPSPLGLLLRRLKTAIKR